MSDIFNWNYELVGITDKIIEFKKHYDNEITIYKNDSKVIFSYDGAYRFELSFDEIATLNNYIKMNNKEGEGIRKFLSTEAKKKKPQLSEDERVILKKFKERLYNNWKR